VFTDLSDRFPIDLSFYLPKAEISVDMPGKFSFRTFIDKEIPNLMQSLQSRTSGLVFKDLSDHFHLYIIFSA